MHTNFASFFVHYSLATLMTNWVHIFTDVLIHMLRFTKWEYWSLTITKGVQWTFYTREETLLVLSPNTLNNQSCGVWRVLIYMWDFSRVFATHSNSYNMYTMIPSTPFVIGDSHIKTARQIFDSPRSVGTSPIISFMNWLEWKLLAMTAYRVFLWTNMNTGQLY